MTLNSYLKCGSAAVLLAASIAGMAAQSTRATDNGAPATADDNTAIRKLLFTYEAALNSSDTNAVMPLYSEDGVFMPPYSQSAVGAAAIRQAYVAVFKAITLSVKFHVAEVVVMDPKWAFARTNSAGTTMDHAKGSKSAEGNQELFIFKKTSDGTWKIARYSFSSTNPPPHK